MPLKFNITQPPSNIKFSYLSLSNFDEPFVLDLLYEFLTLLIIRGVKMDASFDLVSSSCLALLSRGLLMDFNLV